MAKPRIGVVGVPGKWSTEVLADAIELRTGERLVLDLAAVELDCLAGRLSCGAVDLGDLDALVIKKLGTEYSTNSLDRLELLRVAELRGTRVFNRVEALLRLVNRLSCTVTLQAAGVSMPDTRVTENVIAALAAVREFGSAVFKPLYSSKARGMVVLHADQPEPELISAIKAFHAENTMMYIQRKVDLPGRDLGMVFLGGEHLCSYTRIAGNDSWNTTIASGGCYAACSPDAPLLDIAHRAQAAFGMDFTTVDVAETAEGPVVFEVSAFGGFRGALDGAGVDAASAYADYVLGHLDG